MFAKDKALLTTSQKPEVCPHTLEDLDKVLESLKVLQYQLKKFLNDNPK